MHKALGDLIRVEFAVENNEYKNVHFSGDFFCFPEDSVECLAAALEDCPTSDASRAIQDFYKTSAIDVPGITPDNWMKVIRI